MSGLRGKLSDLILKISEIVLILIQTIKNSRMNQLKKVLL